MIITLPNRYRAFLPNCGHKLPPLTGVTGGKMARAIAAANR
jgi:hypothetical protein